MGCTKQMTLTCNRDSVVSTTRYESMQNRNSRWLIRGRGDLSVINISVSCVSLTPSCYNYMYFLYLPLHFFLLAQSASEMFQLCWVLPEVIVSPYGVMCCLTGAPPLPEHKAQTKKYTETQFFIVNNYTVIVACVYLKLYSILTIDFQFFTFGVEVLT